MPYCIEHSYADYFKLSARGEYDSGFVRIRLRATGTATALVVTTGIEAVGRIVLLVIDIAKVAFYSLATLFTLGQFGNGKRLFDHARLLLLDIGALAIAPLQLTIHALAIVVGIVSHRTSYKMMQMALTPTIWIKSQKKQIKNQYVPPTIIQKITEITKSKTSGLFDNHSFALRSAMKTIVTEFTDALHTALVTPLAYLKRFNLHSLNPHSITKEQSNLRPILLIHGNYHHQGAWLPLAHNLEKANNKRPIYTLNLPSGLITNEDFRLVTQKVREVKSQYRQHQNDPKIDLVGHSRGAAISERFALINSHLIHKVITIGTPIYYKSTISETFEVYDIVGSQDILWTEKGFLKEEKPDCYKEIDTGHLGLLGHSECLETIRRFLF